VVGGHDRRDHPAARGEAVHRPVVHRIHHHRRVRRPVVHRIHRHLRNGPEDRPSSDALLLWDGHRHPEDHRVGGRREHDGRAAVGWGARSWNEEDPGGAGWIYPKN
jgi:hypothetical protein